MPVAPGTFGTVLGIPVYLLLRELSEAQYVAGVLLLLILGVWFCQIAERELGAHDHSSIVLDEVVGYLVTLWAAPKGIAWLAVGFVLFRAFDIWKPFPIRRVERLPGGVGVMADDVVAGLYAFASVQILARLSVEYLH